MHSHCSALGLSSRAHPLQTTDWWTSWESRELRPCQTTQWACDPKRQQKGHWCQKFPQATWPTETRWTPTNPILLRLWALPLHHLPSQSGLTATAAVAAHSMSHLWRSSCSLMIPDLAVTLSRQIWNRRIKGKKKTNQKKHFSIHQPSLQKHFSKRAVLSSHWMVMAHIYSNRKEICTSWSRQELRCYAQG